MPKRRSLVGTAREAIGDAGESHANVASASTAPPVEPPAKRPRAAPKIQGAAAQKTASSARAQAETAPERPSAPAASPATAYEAMVGFASATLRQNMETGAKLARCKSPAEVLAAQAAHATALTQNFIAVSLKLMQLGFSGASWLPSYRSRPRTEPQ